VGLGCVGGSQACRGCRRGLRGTLTEKNTKGYVISSLSGDSFNNLGAKAIDSLGTT
jgi:hypothetical protein